MSKVTKRKHVTKEVTDEFVLPGTNRQIVKVLVSRGNNLHEVETASGETFLASMPTKFRKNIWIKRGDFVMVESIEEGDRVKAEISHILYKPQIEYITQHGLWPEQFSNSTNSSQKSTHCNIPDDMLPPSASDEDDDSFHVEETETTRELVYNPNRPVPQNCDDEDDDDDDDDEEAGEGQEESVSKENDNGHR
jgi:probable RNA-binding protein EIF1AD